MISTFHPSAIICTPENWAEENYQDNFLKNLILHLEKINELGIKIAWCNEIEADLWSDPPWTQYYNLSILIDSLIEIRNRNESLEAPPNTECTILPSLLTNVSNGVNKSWSILIHRLIHKKCEVFVVSGFNINNEINSIDVSCNCEDTSYKNNYQIINDPSEWYERIDYKEICPKNLGNWDKDFLLTLKVCHEKEFKQRGIKNKIENLKFSSDFKTDFLAIREKSTKRKIIRAIVKRLISTSEEAAHSGLKEEKVKGKPDEYSFKVSEGERIHYRREEDKMLILDYYSSSEHDTRCK